MKILDSNIAMSSTRTYLQSYEKTESLKTWVGNVRPVFEGETQNTIQDNGASLEISDEAKKLQECNCNNKVNSEDETASEQDMVKIKLIETFVEFFTGKKIKIRIPNFKSKDNQEIKISQTSDGVQAQRRSGWGLEYEFHETKYESEKTTFASKGIIKTCDGKEINFTIDLSMSREFMQQTDISLRAGDAKLVDPLVINFGGNSASLTQTKFSFDLDVDGNNDQISFVSENS